MTSPPELACLPVSKGFEALFVEQKIPAALSTPKTQNLGAGMESVEEQVDRRVKERLSECHSNLEDTVRENTFASVLRPEFAQQVALKFFEISTSRLIRTEVEAYLSEQGVLDGLIKTRERLHRLEATTRCLDNPLGPRNSKYESQLSWLQTFAKNQNQRNSETDEIEHKLRKRARHLQDEFDDQRKENEILVAKMESMQAELQDLKQQLTDQKTEVSAEVRKQYLQDQLDMLAATTPKKLKSGSKPYTASKPEASTTHP